MINYFPKHSVRKEKAMFKYCIQQQLTEIAEKVSFLYTYLSVYKYLWRYL